MLFERLQHLSVIWKPDKTPDKKEAWSKSFLSHHLPVSGKCVLYGHSDRSGVLSGNHIYIVGKYAMESVDQKFEDAIALLAIEQLAGFDKSLADLPDSDKKQRRIQYLQDTIQPIGPGRSFMESLESFVKGMALYLMPLAILFMFLPLFFITRFKMMRKRSALQRHLSKALLHWNIERQELENFQPAA